VIILDAPASYIYRGRPARASHLISTLGGQAGRDELLAFGARIGLRARWLQRRFSAYEHFDLMGRQIDRARAAGATLVERKRLIYYVREKRPVQKRTHELRRTRRDDRRVDPAHHPRE
jgi:hypothetical protein